MPRLSRATTNFRFFGLTASPRWPSVTAMAWPSLNSTGRPRVRSTTRTSNSGDPQTTYSRFFWLSNTNSLTSRAHTSVKTAFSFKCWSKTRMEGLGAKSATKIWWVRLQTSKAAQEWLAGRRWVLAPVRTLRRVRPPG